MRVLVVDDSAIVRGLVSRQLEEHPGIHVVGSSPHGEAAHPRVKVVIASSLTRRNAEISLKALGGRRPAPEAPASPIARPAAPRLARRRRRSPSAPPPAGRPRC